MPILSSVANRVCAVVLALGVTGAGCASDATPTAPTAVPDVTATAETAGVPTTSYDVYRAALARLGPLGGGHPLVVREDTATFPWCRGTAGDAIGEEWREASGGFVEANRASQRLVDGRNLGAPYLVIDGPRYLEFFGSRALEDGWRRFREAYPSGTLVTLSAVGFNRERTRAVVQLGVQCGSLCGEWRDFYLEHQRGLWVVTPLRTCSAIS